MINIQISAKYMVLIFLFILYLFFGIKFKESRASTSSLSLPTSGSCQLLMTLPVPYGLSASNLASSGHNSGVYTTGYNLIGTIAFSSSTTGTFSGVIGNAGFNQINSPNIGPSEYINNATVTITPMTSSTGFVGGYQLSILGTAVSSADSSQQSAGFTINAVPANNSNTIFLQMGGAVNSGVGPGSGVCQV